MLKFQPPGIFAFAEWNRTFLPRDCKQITTEFRFCLSQRSTVWKVSCGGTPNDFAASRKAFIFSIHLKASVVLLIFFTEPSLISFTSLTEKPKVINGKVFISPYFRRFLNQRFLSFPIFLGTCKARRRLSGSRRSYPCPHWCLCFRRWSSWSIPDIPARVPRCICYWSVTQRNLCVILLKSESEIEEVLLCFRILGHGVAVLCGEPVMNYAIFQCTK